MTPVRTRSAGGRNPGNVLCLHPVPYYSGVVDTNHLVRVVDQHIESREEILTEQAAERESRIPHALHVIDDHALISDQMIAHFERVKLCEVRDSAKADACHIGLSCRSEMEFRRKSLIDNGHLGSGVEKKIIGTGTVDRNFHDHFVAAYAVEWDRFDVRGASRFRDEGYGDKRYKKKKCKTSHS